MAAVDAALREYILMNGLDLSRGIQGSPGVGQLPFSHMRLPRDFTYPICCAVLSRGTTSCHLVTT